MTTGCVVIDHAIGSTFCDENLRWIPLPFLVLAAPTDAIENDVNYVYKPVSQQDLADAIRKVLGYDRSQSAGSTRGKQFSAHSLRILVADDSLANRRSRRAYWSLKDIRSRPSATASRPLKPAEREASTSS